MSQYNNKAFFDHEKLEAYKVALDFTAWVGKAVEHLPSKYSVRDQIDRASTSHVLNIAEGNGKFSLRDRRRFFDIALGSGFECAACIDIMVVRNLLEASQAQTGKQKLKHSISLLVGLIKSIERRLEQNQ